MEHAHHGTALDPVCGMTVDPAKAAGHYEYKGTTYHFCSQHIGKGPRPAAAKPAAPKAGKYTCPMHPEIVQEGPGSCPKCGMALVPMVPVVPKAGKYTCPMHPEVVQDGPGSCPKCGMALVPMEGAAEDDSELRDMTRRFWVAT